MILHFNYRKKNIHLGGHSSFSLSSSPKQALTYFYPYRLECSRHAIQKQRYSTSGLLCLVPFMWQEVAWFIRVVACQYIILVHGQTLLNSKMTAHSIQPLTHIWIVGQLSIFWMLSIPLLYKYQSGCIFAVLQPSKEIIWHVAWTSHRSIQDLILNQALPPK